MNLITVYPASDSIDIACFQGKDKTGFTSIPYPECSCSVGSVVETVRNIFGVEQFDVGATCYSMAIPTSDPIITLTPEIVDGICQASYGYDKTNYGTIILASIGAKKMFSAYPLTYDCLPETMKLSGIPQIERRMVGHWLDHSQAYRHACNVLGGEKSVVTCYLSDQEITVAAWKNGKMINMNSSWDGEGAMSMTRSGFFHQRCVYRQCFAGKKSKDEMLSKVRFVGGVSSHVSATTFAQLEELVSNGDSKARLVADAFVYQITKNIGRMSVLCPKPEMISFTGSLATNMSLIENIGKYTAYISKSVITPKFDGTSELAGIIWSHE